MRQHLHNVIFLNQEFGQSEEEATANALLQFGTPEAWDRILSGHGNVRRSKANCGGASGRERLYDGVNAVHLKLNVTD